MCIIRIVSKLYKQLFYKSIRKDNQEKTGKVYQQIRPKKEEVQMPKKRYSKLLVPKKNKMEINSGAPLFNSGW